MKKVCLVWLLTLALSWLCLAQSPVATVSGNAGFKLRGVPVPPYVTSWPVFPGDTITTGNSAVTIRMPDGSRVTLASNSQATLAANGSSLNVKLGQGGASYNIPANAQTQLLGNGGQVLSATGSTGTAAVSPLSTEQSSSLGSSRIVPLAPPADTCNNPCPKPPYYCPPCNY
jgi:hypothetical protein